MTDTTPEAAELLKRLYETKSGEEKLMMALNMFDTARTLVIASMPENLSRKELRKQLFLRFYGNDFNDSQKKEILSAIDSAQF